MRGVTDAQIDAIPGWFQTYDRDLFRLLLPASGELLGGGDLAEFGAYQGKSAVLIGENVREAEIFTIIDLFGSAASDVQNQAENDDQYVGLSRATFERYYRTTVVFTKCCRTSSRDQAPPSSIVRHGPRTDLSTSMRLISTSTWF